MSARCRHHSGCGFLLGLLVLLAAVSAVIEYWPVAVAILVAACTGLRVWGVRAMRKQAREAAQAAAARDAAGPQAKYSDRR